EGRRQDDGHRRHPADVQDGWTKRYLHSAQVRSTKYEVKPRTYFVLTESRPSTGGTCARRKSEVRIEPILTSYFVLTRFRFLMRIVVGVISPAAIWVMPRRFVEQLRHDFPQHTFLDAWDRDTLR